MGPGNHMTTLAPSNAFQSLNMLQSERQYSVDRHSGDLFAPRWTI